MTLAFEHEGMMLRTLEEPDLEAIRALRNCFSTWTQLTDPRLLTRADQAAWYRERSGDNFYVAYDRGHPIVGLVRTDLHDTLNRSIRVGADVLPALRKQGHGRRVYAMLKKYCFDYLNVHRMWLAVLETNSHAMRLYLKQGFQEEGRYREAVFRDGVYVDYILMSLLEQTYRASESDPKAGQTS